jgi:signal transduction histidine kinase
MDDKEIVFLIFSASITILLISIGLIFFLVFLFRMRGRNYYEQVKLKEQYEKELFDAKIEIKDQTLRHVGQELHDNIGQLLIVSRIHLKSLLKTLDNDKLAEVNTITGKALDELRLLSKSLNRGTYINESSLIQLVEKEIQLIEKTGVIRASLHIKGEAYPFGLDHEIICFRIMQEFVSNALKYSGCEKINFELEYLPGSFSFTISDNGKGFNVKTVTHGNGLTNIENRARMIGAAYELNSVPGKGTSIQLKLKMQHETI